MKWRIASPDLGLKPTSAGTLHLVFCELIRSAVENIPDSEALPFGACLKHPDRKSLRKIRRYVLGQNPKCRVGISSLQETYQCEICLHSLKKRPWHRKLLKWALWRADAWLGGKLRRIGLAAAKLK